MIPLQPVNQEQRWLLPPTLDDFIPEDHPAHFISDFVEEMDRDAWANMEIDVDGEPLDAGAPCQKVGIPAS